ncbi:MAG: trans-sulfuration enzyme family protein, partial [Spirochaetota bacterium]
MDSPEHNMETLVVHGRADANEPSSGGPVISPEIRSTVFRHPEPGTGAEFQYTRNGNPNRHELETVLTELERGEESAAFSSGMAATAAVFNSVEPGSSIVIPKDVYHGTRAYLIEEARRWNSTVHAVDFSAGAVHRGQEIADELADIASRSSSGTIGLIWVETPSNPMLHITDISFVAHEAHTHGAIVCVDNTWPSPVNQQPLRYGADLVVHSATKYLGGHSDILAGAVVTNGDNDAFKKIRQTQTMAGAVPSAHDCWMLLRSIKTLSVRMRAHNANAAAVARFLSAHDAVKAVYYPGLEEHPGHTTAARQMTGFGGMISFEVDTDEQTAREIVHRSRFITAATSL